MSILVDVAAILGVVFSVVTFRQAADQFAASGPEYSWFVAGKGTLTVSTDSGGVGADYAYGVVVSNTGRTGDTVVAVTNPDGSKDALRVCTVDFDDAGRLEETGMVSAGGFRLEPGESRLVFLVSREYRAGGRGFSTSIPDRLTVHGASGVSVTADRRTAAEPIVDHYRAFPDFQRALDECRGIHH